MDRNNVQQQSAKDGQTCTNWQAIRERIQEEREYHDKHYADINWRQEVNFDLASSVKRRPWNLAWAYYDSILHHFNGDVSGKRVLAIGCGVGNIALNLGKNGFHVDGFDLCEKAIDVCKSRAHFNRVNNANFFVSACEELDVQPCSYDAVVGEMILHHVDIPITIEKVYRSLRPGGVGVFMEWKEYAVLDRIRSLPFFRWLFPPGGYSGYATDHERKLNAGDFATISKSFPNMKLEFRYCLRGKLDYFFPEELSSRFEHLDYFLLRTFPLIRPFTDGVIILFTKTETS